MLRGVYQGASGKTLAMRTLAALSLAAETTVHFLFRLRGTVSGFATRFKGAPVNTREFSVTGNGCPPKLTEIRNAIKSGSRRQPSSTGSAMI